MRRRGRRATLFHWPYDALRTQLQVSSALDPRSVSWGWLGLMRTMVKNQGWAAVYRGSMRHTTIMAARWAALFATADAAARALSDRGAATPVAAVAAGSAAGCAASGGVLAAMHWLLGFQRPCRNAFLGTAAALPGTVLTLTLLEAAKRGQLPVSCPPLR